MKTNMLTCCKCEDTDYSEYMGRIDGRVYCQMCYDQFFDEMETKIIMEALEVKNHEHTINS